MIYEKKDEIDKPLDFASYFGQGGALVVESYPDKRVTLCNVGI